MEISYLQDKNKPDSLVEMEVVDFDTAVKIQDDINSDRFGKFKKIIISDYEFKRGVHADISVSDLKWLLNEHNTSGMEQHILSLEAKYISDEDFWKIIKKMKWTTDFDFKRIGADLNNMVYGDLGYSIGICKIFSAKKTALKEAIDYNLDKEELDYSEVIGLGDDSLDDLCSNIIGLGKTKYEKALKNVKFAGKQDTNESFAYVFNMDEHFDIKYR
jgi:hypothetical protein